MFDEEELKRRLRSVKAEYNSVGRSHLPPPLSLAPAKSFSLASPVPTESVGSKLYDAVKTSTLFKTIETALSNHNVAVTSERRESPVFRALALALALSVWIPVLHRKCWAYWRTCLPDGYKGPCLPVDRWTVTVSTAVVFLFILVCVLYLGLSTRVRLAFHRLKEFIFLNHMDVLSALTWVMIAFFSVYGSIRLYHAAYAPAARVHQPTYRHEEWQASLYSYWNWAWDWAVGTAKEVAIEQAALATGLPVAAMTVAAFPVGFISTFLSLPTTGWCASIAAFGQFQLSGMVFYDMSHLWVIFIKARIGVLLTLGIGSGWAVQRCYGFLFRLCRHTQAPKSLEGSIPAPA